MREVTVPFFDSSSPISGDKTRQVQTAKAHIDPRWENLNRGEARYAICRSKMPRPCCHKQTEEASLRPTDRDVPLSLPRKWGLAPTKKSLNLGNTRRRKVPVPFFDSSFPISGDKTRQVQTDKEYVYPPVGEPKQRRGTIRDLPKQDASPLLPQANRRGPSLCLAFRDVPLLLPRKWGLAPTKKSLNLGNTRRREVPVPFFDSSFPISGDKTRQVQTAKAHIDPRWENLNKGEARYSICRSKMPRPCCQQANRRREPVGFEPVALLTARAARRHETQQNPPAQLSLAITPTPARPRISHPRAAPPPPFVSFVHFVVPLREISPLSNSPLETKLKNRIMYT